MRRAGCQRHVRDDSQARALAPAGAIADDVAELLDRIMARLLRKAGARSRRFWRGAATLARAALDSGRP